MKAVIFKVATLYFLLLFFSDANPNAQTYQNGIASFLMHDNCTAINDAVENVHSSVANFEQSFKIEVAEIEEDKDKFISLEKYLTGKYSFSILFTDLISTHFFRYVNRREPITCSILHQNSNSSYITFQVFRI